MGQTKQIGSQKYLSVLDEALARFMVLNSSDLSSVSLHSLLAGHFIEISYEDNTRQQVSYYELMAWGLTREMVPDLRRLVQEQNEKLSENKKTVGRLQAKLEESKSKHAQLESSKRQQGAALEAEKSSHAISRDKIERLEREIEALRKNMQSTASVPADTSSDQQELNALKAEVKSATEAWEQTELKYEAEHRSAVEELERAYSQAAFKYHELVECVSDLIEELRNANARAEAFEKKEQAAKHLSATQAVERDTGLEQRLREAEARISEVQDELTRTSGTLKVSLFLVEEQRTRLRYAAEEQKDLATQCKRLSASSSRSKAQATEAFFSALEKFKQEFADGDAPKCASLPRVVCQRLQNLVDLKARLQAWQAFQAQLQENSADVHEAIREAADQARVTKAEIAMAKNQQLDSSVLNDELKAMETEIARMQAHQENIGSLLERARTTISALEWHVSALEVCSQGLPKGILETVIPAVPPLPWSDAS